MMTHCLDRPTHRLKSFLLILAAGCLGCAGNHLGTGAVYDSMPVSNIIAAEHVIHEALESLGIPEGGGSSVTFAVDRADRAGGLLSVLAPEFLMRRGYRVSEQGVGIPEFRFNLDTLYVNIDVCRVHIFGLVVRRYAEARVGAVYSSPDVTRRVYTGRGVYSDTLPSESLKTVGAGESFVHHTESSLDISAAMKPVVTGASVTVLIWLLYSYRS